jgi:hypothetical protein
LRTQPRPWSSPEGLRSVKRALSALTTSLKKLNPAAPSEPLPTLPSAPELELEPDLVKKPPMTDDDRQLLEQLEFIQKVSGDISRVTDAVLA